MLNDEDGTYRLKLIGFILPSEGTEAWKTPLPNVGGTLLLHRTTERLVQFMNAYSPIEVTLSGIVTLLRYLFSLKALGPMVVTVVGITRL